MPRKLKRSAPAFTSWDLPPMEHPSQAPTYAAMERLRPSNLDADIASMLDRATSPQERRVWLALQVERLRRRP